MKRSIVFFLVAFLFARVSAQSECVSDSQEVWLKEIVTSEGCVYHDCRLLKVEPNGILVEYTPQEGALGLAKIRFSILPQEFQKRFNYNPSAASQFEILQAKANVEWARQVNQRQELSSELAKTEQREATALRLAEEKTRLENERLAAVMAHEENLVREEGYGKKEAARWQPPVLIVTDSYRDPNRFHSGTAARKYTHKAKISKGEATSRAIHN